MMPDRIGDLCFLSAAGAVTDENWETLAENIVSAAGFFGFRSLPDELKIKIHICNEAEFNCKKEELHLNGPEYAAAFTYDVNEVFVLEYSAVNRWYSLNAYYTVIVHECIHAFQAYFSMIPPGQFAWLYESVACYLAGQKRSYNGRDGASWLTFINDFYRIDHCYSLAYCFGEAVFKRFGDETLSVIKMPEAYMDQLEKVYSSEIKSKKALIR